VTGLLSFVRDQLDTAEAPYLRRKLVGRESPKEGAVSDTGLKHCEVFTLAIQVRNPFEADVYEGLRRVETPA
jgi:hypothetical protein